MNKFYTFLIISALAVFSACQSQSTETTETSDEPETSTETTTASTETATESGAEDLDESDQTEESETTEKQVGEIHLSFPVVASITAQPGNFVLAPSTTSVEEAMSNGHSGSRMLFYSRNLVEAGNAESTINEFNTEVKMPNSLIIPIRPNEVVQPGDIVLTWWQSASGMTRAVVLEGGSETEPLVQYLDLRFESEPEALAPNSFHKLNEQLEPGTTVAYPDGDQFAYGFVINRVDGKLLVANTFDILEVVAEQDATPIPLKPEVKVGDAVFIPVIGHFNQGTVTEIDTAKALVTVSYEWAGSETTEKFPFGSILKSL